MKKFFYGVCTALLLCVLVAFAGCKPNGKQAEQFLKGKHYVGNPPSFVTYYDLDFQINEDLSYSLKVSTKRSSSLNDYSVTGTTMEYLGYTQKTTGSEWLGVSLSNTTYFHVFKLPEATVEDSTFFVIASTSSKSSDDFYVKLTIANSSYGKNEITAIVEGQGDFNLRLA